MTPSSVRYSFFSVLDEAEKNIDLYVNKPGSDMTRHRFCDFKDTVLNTLCFSMSRTNTELDDYFGINNRHIPSKSAFTQQRKKFNDNLYPSLLRAFNDKVPMKNTYKGFHLVAVDGTDLNLPTDKNDTVYRVKQARSDNCYYQMHLNVLYDICENRYISAVTQPRPQMNENVAFCELVQKCGMPENTIFIGDRGYFALNTIATLIENNRYFLIRAKSPASAGSFTKNLIQSDAESDKCISIHLTRNTSRKALRNLNNYKRIRGNQSFDFIKRGDTKSVYDMNIRISCIKLDDDSYEYLVSNLPMNRFTAADLKDLYWKRWSVETSFRNLKYALSLSYLHSVSRALIIQEIYAKMILYNITALIHAFVQSCKEFKKRPQKEGYTRKVSFTDAVPIVKQHLKQRIKNDTIKALLLSHLTLTEVMKVSARHLKSQSVNALNNRA